MGTQKVVEGDINLDSTEIGRNWLRILSLAEVSIRGVGTSGSAATVLDVKLQRWGAEEFWSKGRRDWCTIRRKADGNRGKLQVVSELDKFRMKTRHVDAGSN
jgi:hypothetical protein